MVELQHYVISHGDIYFQRIKGVNRMNYFNIMSNNSIKNEFFSISDTILTYASYW